MSAHDKPDSSTGPGPAGKSKKDRLTPYRAKRSVEATPEPFGEAGGERPYLFVIQKHAARRTHYDLRLEWGGTLISWAVPNGPSLDPNEKRLAVHVEDHPVEYADFEGIIPAGNYGAGSVIVWDRGRWTPIDDPDQLLQSGKLHFVLEGYKLRGEWILVRTKRGPNEWLLFKKKDAWAGKPGEPPPFGEESVLSGLTVEELKDGHRTADEIRARLVARDVPRRRIDPASHELMLAETADEPFSSPDWVFELKYDGYRLVAARRPDGSAMLRYRNGQDVTGIFPELARALRALPFESFVLDGEVVVLNAQGHPDFQRLQARAQIRKSREAERAAVPNPVTLFLFDIPGFEDFDLRALPLVERKELLRLIVPRAGSLRYSDHVAAQGQALFERVRALGLEGLIAKRAQAPYRGGRSKDWLKLVADRTGDFVVCGYTVGKGSRASLGALHLGAYEGQRLIYAGRVGSGFDARTLTELKAGLETLQRPTPPCEGPTPSGKDHVWVDPKLVVEVRYKTWTEADLLRHSVFSRVRPDKSPQECVHPRARAEGAVPQALEAADPMERAEAAGDAPPPSKGGAKRGARSASRRESSAPRAEAPRPTPTPPDSSEQRKVSFTNRHKIFWPEERYTKGDLIDYYRAVSPWLLPYLADRPVVLTRYPDGIGGKSFYQKDAPVFTPEWIRTVSVWSESSEKEIRYIVVENLEALLFLANLGSIPLHIWSSCVATLQRPDWCILDLDPKGASFAHVVTLALSIRKLCDEIGLPSFIKTSGSTGLHVLIPLGRQCTYEQSRMLGQLIARVIHEQHADIATITRTISGRGGKVYLDFLQNRHGQLLVSPYSVRPLPGAPVSTPLDWDEVNESLEMGAFDIRTVPARLDRRGRDNMTAVLSLRPDLPAALARLAARMEGSPSKRSGNDRTTS